MGKLTRQGYADLDALVEERGMDWIHDTLMGRLADGESPREIAREAFGLPWVVLRGWIEKNCPEDIALAGRARADELEWKATNSVDNAEPETVAVARLQADHYMKLAGKLDRSKYGDKAENGGGGGITVVVQRGGVLQLGAELDKGYPAQGMPQKEIAVEGEFVEI